MFSEKETMSKNVPGQNNKALGNHGFSGWTAVYVHIGHEIGHTIQKPTAKHGRLTNSVHPCQVLD